MTIVRAQARPAGSVNGHLPIPLIRASGQEARAKKLSQNALAGRKIEGPEPGRLADGHAEVRGVLELFPNPLHKFAKERGGPSLNDAGLQGMNGYESAGRHVGVNARH